jgi:hypothetical protein
MLTELGELNRPEGVCHRPDQASFLGRLQVVQVTLACLPNQRAGDDPTCDDILSIGGDRICRIAVPAVLTLASS